MSASVSERSKAPTVKSAAARLLPTALGIWLILFATGWLLTHTFKDGVLAHWDHSVDQSLASHRTGQWNTVTHYITFGAETTTVIGIGIVAFVALRFISHSWRPGIFLAVTLIGEVTIFVATTLVVERSRPAVPHLDTAPPTSSFPSGHTAAAVALYASLFALALALRGPAWLRTLLGILAVAMPVAVGISRLYRGMHFPTDVLCGAIFSLSWLLATRAVLLRQDPVPR